MLRDWIGFTTTAEVVIWATGMRTLVSDSLDGLGASITEYIGVLFEVLRWDVRKSTRVRDGHEPVERVNCGDIHQTLFATVPIKAI